MSKKGINVVELMITILIISILASIAIPSYYGVVERMRRREAEANLKLLQAAVKIRNMESGNFISCNNTDDCNNRLGLEISNSSYFSYKVILQNGTICIEASSDRVSYHINYDSNNILTGGC